MRETLIALAALVALAALLVPAALAARVSVRVEGRTQSTLRRARDPLRGRCQRDAGARGGQPARRVLLPRHHDVVRAVRRPDRPAPGRRHERVGLQGQRRLAAGRGRPGSARRRRPRALVLGDVRPYRRPDDAAPDPHRGATATASWPRTTRARTAPRREPCCSWTAGGFARAPDAAASAGTPAPSGRRSRAPSARTRCR